MKEQILNAAINHLKKSPILKGAVKVADDYMGKLNKDLTRETIEISQLLAKLSPATDDLIIGFERDEGLNFIGGELTVGLLPQQLEDFAIQLKLYFKNKQEKVILKEVNKILELNLLTANSVAELNLKGRMEFEVNAPVIVKNKR